MRKVKEDYGKHTISREGKRNIVKCVIAVVIALIFLFPLYWLASMSFKTDAEVFGKILTYYPHEFTIDPWMQNLADYEFVKSFKNSVIIALLSMTLSIGIGVPTAYGLGRYQMPGGKLFLLIFLVTQMLPSSSMLTPMYLIFSKMKLLSTYLAPALAISTGSIAFIVVTLRPYFKSVPKSLDEASRIDGCGALKSFIYVMLPAIKTGIVTVGVISFLHGWGDMAYSMTFNVTADLRPMTANIYKFIGRYGMQWNCIMAYGTILALPVVVLFVGMQKHIVGGLTAGSVKE